jgi:hypothetical protein
VFLNEVLRFIEMFVIELFDEVRGCDAHAVGGVEL